MEQIYIIWLTPIFSPFVRLTRGRGAVSSPFDLGNWSPYYTVQHVLQTIANFLTLNPLCCTIPSIDHGILKIPWKFSHLPEVSNYANSEDASFHAAQFFSRAYNRVSRETDDPPTLESQTRASTTAISEAVRPFLRGGRFPLAGPAQTMSLLSAPCALIGSGSRRRMSGRRLVGCLQVRVLRALISSLDSPASSFDTYGIEAKTPCSPHPHLRAPLFFLNLCMCGGHGHEISCTY